MACIEVWRSVSVQDLCFLGPHLTLIRLDKVVALELRSLLESFMQAFKYCYVSVQYTMLALNNLRRLLESWDEDRSSSKRWAIETILKHYALAFASAVDASQAYSCVRGSMEVVSTRNLLLYCYLRIASGVLS